MAATGYRGRARFAPGERSEKSAAVHTSLDEAGALINSVHAKVLSDVIRAKDWNIHRDFDGFSALRDWLTERFDFHVRIAADLAAIARLSKKFGHLAEAATTGAARIDQVAYAVRQLEKTPAMRLYARTPYREPVASPFAPAVSCPTPEHLVAEYCAHASFAELKAHLAEMEASLAEHAEILDDLSEQSLQRLEVWQTETGMWALSGLLSSTTGHMLDKLLQTAVPPPRQDETDADRVLPAAANRNAEALHHMLGVYAADPKAAKRHGETCRLHLAVDVETLQGKDTGRTPALEGRPISLELARLLACEAQVVPMVFDYGTGEAIELGRAERLPNTALRRKLVAEQPSGCAWKGCGRPAVQCEAHHIRPWWAGGETSAENLILLCRFHHGRVHTPGWTVTKTAPGRALIVHHQGHEERLDTEAGTGCGCADWRSAEDLDAEFADDVANVFPTGLFPEEWGPSLREDL
ncbi:HNH endonuclease signature motif containing protein, partial [Glycomyces halotolerans]